MVNLGECFAPLRRFLDKPLARGTAHRSNCLSDMATNYLFVRNDDNDEYRVTLAGKHLVTSTAHCRNLVQRFKSEEAANAHFERVAQDRRLDGYVLRHVADVANDASTLSLDPLDEYVTWTGKQRLTVDLTGVYSLPWMKKVIARIEKERPRTLAIDFYLLAPPDERFSQAFIGSSLPSVRRLLMSSVWVCQRRTYQYGDLAHVLKAMPSLRHAFITGDLVLTPLCHASIRALYLEGDPIRSSTMEALGQCSFPRLETLAVTLCEQDTLAGLDEAAAAALAAVHAPMLDSIDVNGIQNITRFLERFASSGFGRSVRTLCLDGNIDDEDALLETLAQYASAFESLELLALPLIDQVSSCAVSRAKDLVKCFVDRSNVPSPLTSSRPSML
jgi:hypothetical protein